MKLSGLQSALNRLAETGREQSYVLRLVIQITTQLDNSFDEDKANAYLRPA